jgi:hypothetical protein
MAFMKPMSTSLNLEIQRCARPEGRQRDRFHPHRADAMQPLQFAEHLEAQKLSVQPRNVVLAHTKGSTAQTREMATFTPTMLDSRACAHEVPLTLHTCGINADWSYLKIEPMGALPLRLGNSCATANHNRHPRRKRKMANVAGTK